MKRWSVIGHVSGGKYLGDFEAETEEAAIELALESEAATVHLCHVCCNQCEDPTIEDGTAEEMA